MTAALHLGDCLDVLRELPDASVDAVVTDPPYGINFMGKAWDGKAIEEASRRHPRDFSGVMRPTGDVYGPGKSGLTERTQSAFANRAGEAGAYDFSVKGNRAFQQWTEQWAREAFRVLKPGGHLLCFAATRTYHRMAAGVEDAGFEIRDCLAWMFGSGFPKSLDVSKAIDARAGADREPDEYSGANGLNQVYGANMGGGVTTRRGEPVTAAAAWDGWGTALKPAFEPIVLARKPLVGTVAANVLEHGTGALNVDACRIDTREQQQGAYSGSEVQVAGEREGGKVYPVDLGRWPANVLLDEDAARMLDEQTGESVSRIGQPRAGTNGDGWGGASRFFYCAKVSRAERNAGLDGFEEKAAGGMEGRHDGSMGSITYSRNVHPTVKPIDLMRWLIRLVTPPDGVVLDPFLGSGSTGCAAALEGRPFIGIEREADYMRIAEARIHFWDEHGEAGLDIVRARETAERARAEIADAGQTDIFAALAEGAA